jgi:nucleoside-diphosphate-sugar epimerase
VQETPQKETTPFYPRSPYAVAKLYAYWITVNYREAYGIYACNGILFNHESPVRGETFVTRKITRAMARIAGPAGLPVPGQPERAARLGPRRDYVEMQWLMLQQDQPKTSSSPPACNTACASSSIRRRRAGHHHSVRRRGREAKSASSRSGDGKKAKCKVGDVIVKVDPRYFRPTEVETLLGDPTKAREKLGWTPKTSLPNWSRKWSWDYSAKRDALVKLAGFKTFDHHESQTSMSHRIYVAGHRGMVGSAIVRVAWKARATPTLSPAPTPSSISPTKLRSDAFFSGKSRTSGLLAAAKVGGIHANNTYPADFIYQNLMIEANVIQAAHAAGVQRLLFLGSSCIYPRKLAPQPMREDACSPARWSPPTSPTPSPRSPASSCVKATTANTARVTTAA